MDSVASDWFWFWLPLLVVVVVVVRALAVPSSLLVSWSSLTSLSHHIWGVIQDPDSSSPTARREQARRLQNGRKRRIPTRISRFGSRFSASSFSLRSVSRSSSSRSSSASGISVPPAYSLPQPPEASEKINIQAAFEDFLKVFFLGYLFHCQQQHLQEQQQAEQQAKQQQKCQLSVSTGTQTEPALPSPSTAASTWTATDLDAIEQQAAEQTEQVEQIDKQADVQTGKQARQQVEQTNAQAVELQEQANGDIPAMSPRLENVETDLQNDSDVYTETWEENGYKFRYTDLTRRANGQIRRRPDMQTDLQPAEQPDVQTDEQADEQLEEQII